MTINWYGDQFTTDEMSTRRLDNSYVSENEISYQLVRSIQRQIQRAVESLFLRFIVCNASVVHIKPNEVVRNHMHTHITTS